MQRFTTMGTMLAAALAIAPGATSAACPEGRIEVVRTAPSGRHKVLCVPESAANGLQAAADHAAGDVAAACPCWTAGELQAVLAKAPYGVLCLTTAYGKYQCYTMNAVGKDQLVFALDPVEKNACLNYVSGVYGSVTATQLDACRQLLDENLAVPCPCWSEADLATLSDAGKLLCDVRDTVVDCRSLVLDSAAPYCASPSLGVPATKLLREQLASCQESLAPYLPGACPCWTARDLEMLAAAGRLSCTVKGPVIDCVSVVLDTATPSCEAPKLVVPETPITAAQLGECRGLLSPYVK